MLLAHKIELRPTEEQKEYLDKACGTKRHCFNQLLEHFSKEENPFSLQAANAYYREIRAAFEWYSEVAYSVSQNTVQDLYNAFSHFSSSRQTGTEARFS